jgi:hypothetical protein
MSERFQTHHPEGSIMYYRAALDWIEEMLDGSKLTPAGAVARFQQVGHDLATALWRTPEIRREAGALAAGAYNRATEIATAAGFPAQDALERYMAEQTASQKEREALELERLQKAEQPRPSIYDLGHVARSAYEDGPEDAWPYVAERVLGAVLSRDEITARLAPRGQNMEFPTPGGILGATMAEDPKIYKPGRGS